MDRKEVPKKETRARTEEEIRFGFLDATVAPAPYVPGNGLLLSTEIDASSPSDAIRRMASEMGEARAEATVSGD